MSRINEIEARLSAIKAELEGENADVAALSAETDGLLEERAQIKADFETRKSLLDKVSTLPEEGEKVIMVEETRSYNAESKEYRSAFLKNLAGREEDFTVEERAAFVATTANTAAPLPTQMLNEIWDLVNGQHPIIADVTTYRTGVTIEVVKHTEIVQGKAKKVAEGAANDDEQNTFVKVTLSGNDFSKHVDISYAMAKMSIDALEAYLKNEIAASLGAAIAEDIVAQIETDVNAANKVSSAKAGEVGYAELAKAFGSLKRVQNVTLYATRATIYNYLVGMVDVNGRPIFQPNAQVGAEGTLLGATIKVEDGVADGKILIGDPKKVVNNVIQDIMIESDKDVKHHVITHSGYARCQSALIDDKSFVVFTVGAEG